MVNCSVMGCKSRSESKQPNITFHTFPQDDDILTVWLRATGRYNWMPTKYSRICSKHFEEHCFRKSQYKVYVDKFSIPTLFIHNIPVSDINIEMPQPSTSKTNDSTDYQVNDEQLLVSLKAELLRKQEEINEKKQLPQHKLENFKPPPAKPSSNENKTKKVFKDSLKAVDLEELEANRRSRVALEKKAELYEHLADKSGSSELQGRFLVDFSSKKEQDDEYEQKLKENAEDSNYDSEWVEFTDCLGRTRRCIKSDLEYFMKRDKLLQKDLTKEGDHLESGSSREIVKENNPKQEMPFLVQKTNDYLQSLREKWEQKEKELLGKDKDIHYQDLLFDEARIHGVGYYAFSTDETERRKQMEEIMKQREETLRAQRETEQLRKKRDELVAARLAAARARQRARQGLPPEPDPPADNQKDFTACLLEFLTQQKNEADEKAKEAERKAKEEQEKERQKLRDAHIREWDFGKEGMEDKVKKFREMTQEEYVEQQRSKRIKEFAPLKDLSAGRSEIAFDETGRRVGTLKKPCTKTWADVRPKGRTPPPPDISDMIVNEEQKGLYFSSSNKSNPQMKYKNFTSVQEPIPIENELSDQDDDDSEPKRDKRKLSSSHVEIEPPPTYDYYGPTPKYSKTEKPFKSDIREAYAQGAKSLENKSNDRQLSKQYDFTFD